jgi:ribosome biogenesis GTPase
MFLVIAPDPSCYPALIARTVIASRYTGIPLTFVINKCDLLNEEKFKERFDYLIETLKPFMNNTTIIYTDATNHSVQELLSQFKPHQTSLIFGQSGVGKSTLLNVLIPNLALQTATLSSTLDSGKHTTTTTKSYELPLLENCIVLDSPGFQEFGLAHLTVEDIWNCLPELHPKNNEVCRFKNCQHLNEPQCAVLADEARENTPYFDLFYQLYLTLRRERKIESLY